MSIDRMVGDASPGGGDFVEYRRPARVKSERPRRWRPTPQSFILLAGCLLGGAILARGGGTPPGPATPHSLSQAGFVVDERLAPMASFSPPGAVRTSAHYQARIRESSGERWDTLTFGDASIDELLFRVTLRSDNPALARSSLFVALAKQSAEIGAAVVHATSPQLLATERGPVEWAEITLSGPNGERACLGFRLDGARSVDLSGLACASRGAPLDRAGLIRLIDRLSPTNSGMEAGLGEVLKGGAT
jgi:hypothetical protein